MQEKCSKCGGKIIRYYSHFLSKWYGHCLQCGMDGEIGGFETTSKEDA